MSLDAQQPKKPMMKKMISVVVAAALAAFLGILGSELMPGKADGTIVFPHSRMEILRTDGSKAAFDIELATTPEQQERGLMFRKNLAPDAGMLFLWPTDEPVSMWMKNTFISLDMLYVAHDGRIAKIIANAVPLDLTPLPSDDPIRAVIEIGGGEAARQNIKTGDKVLFSGFQD
jgi:uncharacterized protein